MSRAVPGSHDVRDLCAALSGPDAAEYRRRAEQHRPDDLEAIAEEIRHLRASGLQPRDISMALGIDLGQVLEALQWPLMTPQVPR